MRRLLACTVLLASGCPSSGGSRNRDLRGPLPDDLVFVFPDDGGTDDLTMSEPADLTTLPDLAKPVVCNGPGNGSTGEECTMAAQCQGTKPNCITKDMTNDVWPCGYCTSSCNPSQNDQQTGLNAACPGGAGTCAGSGTTGTCVTACTGKNGNMPCARDGYSCFVVGTTLGCEPTALSQCDPTMKGSCGAGQVCVPIGDDPVGECVPACDPFKQDCPMAMGQTQGCYASFMFGEGSCSLPFGGGQDGTACQYLNSCDPGFGCHPEANNSAFCRPYCGGPNNVACNNGRMCVPLSAMSPPINVIGVCGG